MIDIVFEKLRRLAEKRWPDHVETSLLGKVYCDDSFNGVIPEWVAEKAANHGLEVLVADCRSGTYSFRLVYPPMTKFMNDPRR